MAALTLLAGYGSVGIALVAKRRAGNAITKPDDVSGCFLLTRTLAKVAANRDRSRLRRVLAHQVCNAKEGRTEQQVGYNFRAEEWQAGDVTRHQAVDGLGIHVAPDHPHREVADQEKRNRSGQGSGADAQRREALSID